MSAADLLARLDGVRQTGAGRWIARCPAHNDKRPSLSIREMEDGRVLIHCFGGCAAAEVVDAAGLELADLFPPRRPGEHYRRGSRPHVPASDVLRLIVNELFVVLAAAYTVSRGALSVEDLARLEVAADRIANAMRLAGGAV